MTDAAPAKPHEDGSIKETLISLIISFVMALVFRSYVIEAFIIPTGSMDDTLWGYQKVVLCPQCKYQFPVNCSQEVEPQDGRRREPVLACTCPNCRLRLEYHATIEMIDPPVGRVDTGYCTHCRRLFECIRETGTYYDSTLWPPVCQSCRQPVSFSSMTPAASGGAGGPPAHRPGA